jgi:hypothetical protein
MSNIVVPEFVPIDGVAQDPGGVGDFDQGGWALKFEGGPEGDRFKLDEVLAAEALLLRRRTYGDSRRRGRHAPVNLRTR